MILWHAVEDMRDRIGVVILRGSPEDGSSDLEIIFLTTNTWFLVCYVLTNDILRNGLSGSLLYTKHNTAPSPHLLPQRTRRTNLQSALLAVVSPNTIKLNKKLVSMVEKNEEVVLAFADGEEVVADLVIGGDGIRSVSRRPRLF